MTTRNEFDAFVSKVCGEAGIDQRGELMVQAWAEENGSDCGDEQWAVAAATVREAIDQGLLVRVATVGSAY